MAERGRIIKPSSLCGLFLSTMIFLFLGWFQTWLLDLIEERSLLCPRDRIGFESSTFLRLTLVCVLS